MKNKTNKAERMALVPKAGSAGFIGPTNGHWTVERSPGHVEWARFHTRGEAVEYMDCSDAEALDGGGSLSMRFESW